MSTYFTASGGGLCAGSPKQVCRRTDARGITTTYSYDGENRLTSKTYSDSTPPAYYYYDESSVSVAGSNYTVTNGKGRMTHTSAASGGAITVDSYDAAGHVADLWQCTPYNCSSGPLWDMHYDYLQGGEVSDYVHPAGYTISYTVANDGRIAYIGSSLVDATHPRALASVEYAPQGAVYSLMNDCVGTGCAQIYEYDFYNRRLERAQSVLGNSNASPTVACQVYNYYASVANPTSCAYPAAGTGDDGNVIGHYDYDAVNTSLSHTAAYGYDAMHRLTSAAATGSSTYNLAYSYDQYGNMTCTQNRTTQGLCPQYGFNTSTNRINNSGYLYDAAGDLFRDGAHFYQYDAEGRLTLVDKGGTASYVYNALGQRVEKNVGGTYTEYVLDADGDPLGENNRTSWTDTWVTFNGQHIAHYQNNETYFIHGDFQGTTGIVTDYTGAVVQDELHYPWGQEWTMTGTMTEERFASLRHRDTETSLDPTHFRMFSSGSGRWLTPDPAQADLYHPQSMSRYAYALNRPTALTDPKGLSGVQIYMAVPTDDLYDLAEAGGSGVIMGNDIFDAIAGAPGTYLTLDQYGNVGFGFSIGLYNQTQNFISSEQAGCASQGNKPGSVPTAGYTVVTVSNGNSSQSFGLIPDLNALSAADAFVQQLFASQGHIVPSAGMLTNTDMATLQQLNPQLYSKAAPYVSAYGQLANSFANEVVAFFGVP